MTPPPSTEHVLMDSEHRALLDWAREGARRLQDAKPVDETVYALDALRHLARSHFEHERVEMRAMGYPDWFVHAQEHENLLAELSRLRHDIFRLNAGAAGGFLDPAREKLAGWMHSHISDHDQRYANWLRQRGSAPAAARGERRAGTA